MMLKRRGRYLFSLVLSWESECVRREVGTYVCLSTVAGQWNERVFLIAQRGDCDGGLENEREVHL